MSDPIEIFNTNWQKARTAGDPNAHYCTLATVADSGQVAMRTLVLREVTDGGFTIFTSATSPKWRDLNSSRAFELLVFWPTLMQQYRIRGQLEAVDDELMQIHWARKPYEAKILDLYYASVASQSSLLDSRGRFLEQIDQLKKQFPSASDISYPQQVRGITIRANYIEVWQGSDVDRLHHRSLYLQSDAHWQETILVP